jgi:tetratricopeptide (TPR) repeat protein
MNREFPLAHLWLARAFQQKGMYAEAIIAYQKAEAVLRNWVPVKAGMGNVYGLWGKKDEARRVLSELRELAKEAYVTPYGVALVYAGLGEKEQAFAQLQEAYEQRSHWLVWLKLDPRWEGLRPNPRFAELVRRVGLAP